MPWVGNIAKTMMSNGKQFTVPCEMLTAVARDGWNLSVVFKFCFCFVLLYNKSLNDWSLGEQWIFFPSNLNVSLDFVSGNIENLGKQNSLFTSGPVINCLVLTDLIEIRTRSVLNDLSYICPHLVWELQTLNVDLLFRFSLNQMFKPVGWSWMTGATQKHTVWLSPRWTIVISSGNTVENLLRI